MEFVKGKFGLVWYVLFIFLFLFCEDEPHGPGLLSFMSSWHQKKGPKEYWISLQFWVKLGLKKPESIKQSATEEFQGWILSRWSLRLISRTISIHSYYCRFVTSDGGRLKIRGRSETKKPKVWDWSPKSFPISWSKVRKTDSCTPPEEITQCWHFCYKKSLEELNILCVRENNYYDEELGYI